MIEGRTGRPAPADAGPHGRDDPLGLLALELPRCFPGRRFHPSGRHLIWPASQLPVTRRETVAGSTDPGPGGRRRLAGLLELVVLLRARLVFIVGAAAV